MRYSKLFRIFVFFLDLCLVCLFTPGSIFASNDFQTGWWIDTSTPLKTYYDLGQRFFLIINCPNGSTSYLENRLNEAALLNVKIILGFNCSDNTPWPATATQFTSYINTLKNYPALYGYYIADEPDWTSDQTSIARRHNYLLTDPGYYSIIKKVDPVHPAMISFNEPPSNYYWDISKTFFDVLDIVGMHAYPSSCSDGEWQSSLLKYSIDNWKLGMNDAQAQGKSFIATMKGFGARCPDYKLLTYNESRYQVFSAVVLGIDKILFWMDAWGYADGYNTRVNQLVTQLQEIGPQMKAGLSSDPRIGVSISDRNQLAFRYGEANGLGIVLAVNIANRNGTGSTLSNVNFTVPALNSSNQVVVLDENRTLPMMNGSFTDSFMPFAVHVYSFPITLKTGDINGDGAVNILDYTLLSNAFATNNSAADLNHDGVVNVLDYTILSNNFGT